MLGIIKKIEDRYHSEVINHSNEGEYTGNFPKKYSNVASLDEIDALYNEIIPITLRKISAYIRKNPAYFIQIED